MTGARILTARTMHQQNILVWLPSPLGDAILCTPALRAIRNCFVDGKICFFVNSAVHQVLSPCQFNDEWLIQQTHSPFAIAKALRRHKFSHAILFKNSFASALAAFLAGIPSRIGYAREARGLLLTDRLQPPREPSGKYKSVPMIDYYLAIASWLGADITNRSLQLQIEQDKTEQLCGKLPAVLAPDTFVIVLVPGAAFGPSKCWLPDRYAETADWLTENYNATVVVSVAPNPSEKKIAEQICRLSKHKLLSLVDTPLSLSELKSLFSLAELVITNDTGPRHIAIALRRKVITLFGPNDPAWTETGYENEIQIIPNVDCAPCQRKKCRKPEHLCMQAISVEEVCNAASQLLDNA
jgi:heptosyltransferase-2